MPKLAIPRAILPGALVAALLSPAPVLANHSDGTYTGASASNGTVTLMVTGNTLNISVNDPCGGSDSGQTTIAPTHTFNFDDGVDFAILGEFHQPFQARGNYQVTMGCPLTTWTADIPPTIDIGDHATAKEGKHWAAFPVQLSHAIQGAVQVGFQTMNGSAVAGKDYLSISGTMLFMPGETQQQIRVPILDDSKHDKKKKESFRVILSNPQGATIADGDGDGWITDNDKSRRQLSGCECQDFKFLKPKKKPEAFLFEEPTTGLRFVNLKIPVRYKILCSMGPLGCAAYVFLDEKFTKVTWNAPGVIDLHVLPKVLGCGGPCNGKWTEGETGFIYTGLVTGDWPTSGSLRFHYRDTCGDEAELKVEATVTFPGPPPSGGAIQGDVDIDYTFG